MLYKMINPWLNATKISKRMKTKQTKKEDTGLGHRCCQTGKEEEKERKKEVRSVGGRKKEGTYMRSWPSIS